MFDYLINFIHYIGSGAMILGIIMTSIYVIKEYRKQNSNEI